MIFYPDNHCFLDLFGQTVPILFQSCLDWWTEFRFERDIYIYFFNNINLFTVLKTKYTDMQATRAALSILSLTQKRLLNEGTLRCWTRHSSNLGYSGNIVHLLGTFSPVSRGSSFHMVVFWLLILLPFNWHVWRKEADFHMTRTTAVYCVWGLASNVSKGNKSVRVFYRSPCNLLEFTDGFNIDRLHPREGGIPHSRLCGNALPKLKGVPISYSRLWRL